MALRDLWRGRERHGEDRDRQWGRSISEDWRSGEDWRDEGRYGRERGGVFGSSEREYSGAGRRYGENFWSPESDYSSGRSYGQGGYEGYGERDEGRRYGSGSFGRDYERGEYGRGYGGGYGSSYGSSQGYGRGGGYGYGMGQFRGRGPRGYQRSDDRIREDVCERLTDDPDIDASNLEVTVKNGEVTLSGSVSSRDDKRRAEECAEDISGVKDVHNTLRVSMEQSGSEQMSTQQTTQQTARH
jgi:hypothetical protein